MKEYKVMRFELGHHGFDLSHLTQSLNDYAAKGYHVATCSGTFDPEYNNETYLIILERDIES